MKLITQLNVVLSLKMSEFSCVVLYCVDTGQLQGQSLFHVVLPNCLKGFIILVVNFE